jgi:RNA polymerase sigma-70 factor (ECF subfamily)
MIAVLGGSSSALANPSSSAARLKEPHRSSLFSVVDEMATAIEALYRERYTRFRNGVAPVAGSYEAARDAVQEGFARALRSRDQYLGRGSLEGWVWRIVLRTALEQRRPGEDFPLDAVDPVFVEPERDFALAAAVRELPPRRRLVAFLRYFADLPYETIAEVLGIEAGTVAATLAQARHELAETLKKEGVRP